MALQPDNGDASLFTLLLRLDRELVGGGVPVVLVATARHVQGLHERFLGHAEATREELEEEPCRVIGGGVRHSAQREPPHDHRPGLEDVDLAGEREAAVTTVHDHFAPRDAGQVLVDLAGEVKGAAHVVGLDGDDAIGVIENDGAVEFVSEQGCGVEHGAFTNFRFLAGVKGLFIL